MYYNLWQAFADTVERHHEKIAIYQGDHSVSFHKLLARARDIHRWFVAAKGKHNDRVIIWMENSAEMASTLFGLWAGGWYSGIA